MTIYLAYAVFPHYLEYWLKEVVDDCNHYEEDENFNFIGLYAWTTNKELMNEFKESRYNKYFIYRETKGDKSLLKEFKKEFSDCKLSRQRLCKPDIIADKGRLVTMTNNEYNNISEPGNIIMYWYNIMGVVTEDYVWFNDELIDALDLIGYTSEFDTMFGGDDTAFSEDEIESRMEFASYMRSYNMTVNGKPYMGPTDNQFQTFLVVYEPILLGEKSELVKQWKRGIYH